MTKFVGVATLICQLLAISLASSAAVPGQQDMAFGDAGLALQGFGHGDDSPRAMATDSSGRIVVAGIGMRHATRQALVVRYLPNGSLDTSFGQGGAVWRQTSNAQGATGVAIQPDGRIVVTSFSVLGWSASRFLSDGSPDLDFGLGGIAPIDVPDYAYLGRTLIQGDGKILMVGTALFGSTQHLTAARLLPNGSPDLSFAGDGVANVVQGLASVGLDVGVLNGRIVIAGYTLTAPNTFAVLLVQMTDNGSLDPTFGSNGQVVTPVGTTAVAYALAFQVSLTVAPKILIAGKSNLVGARQKFLVVRYLSNGALDPSFDGDGILVATISGREDWANAIGVQYSGSVPSRIVVAGTVDADGSAPPFMAIARLTLAGTWDTSFDGDGLALNQAGPTTGDLLRLTNTGILCVGSSQTQTDQKNFILVRRNYSNGAMDPTFDGDGVRTDDFSDGWASPADLAVQPDGRIVVAGSAGGTPSQVAVSRMLPDGTPDTSFAGDGTFQFPSEPGVETSRAVAIQADGKIVIAYDLDRGPSQRYLGVARVLPDGTPDLGFALNGKFWISFNLNPVVSDIVLDSTGGSVVCGNSLSFPYYAFVLRVTAAGTLDSSFANNNAIVQTPGGWTLRASAVQSDGRIVLVGDLPDGSIRRASAFRIHADGTPDVSFGFESVTWLTVLGGDTRWLDAAVLPDASILLVGQQGSLGFYDGLIVARYLPNGTLDPSFAGNGAVRILAGPMSANDNYRLAVQPDGRFLVSAKGDNGLRVLRLESDGTVDPSYGTYGWATALTSSPTTTTTGVVIDGNGDAIVTGAVGSSGTIGAFATARLFSGNSATAVPPGDPSFGSSLTLVAHPNPSSGASVIRLEVRQPSLVTASVYDLAGRRVRVLSSGQFAPAGPRDFPWDGRNQAGHPVAGGVYFIRATAGNETASTRVMILR